jgi:hypothetical protein
MGASGPVPPAVVVAVRNLYGATVAVFAVILALAVWLAHGL